MKPLLRALLLLSVLLVAASRADAATLTLPQYITSLEQLRGLVGAHRLDAARAAGKALIGAEIIAPNGETFHADGTLLVAVERLQPGGELLVSRRLEVALTALRKLAPAASLLKTDPQLLERLRDQERVIDPRSGGKVGMPKAPEIPLSERMLKSIKEILNWIGDHFAKLLDWLGKFWPKSAPKLTGSTAGMRWIVASIVGVILLSLGILAFEVIRRSRRSGGAGRVAESVPAAAARDEDPLSRAAGEWELYAERLAAAGRIREAIRAWYHAVLVTLCTAGILQFRKGRTNWEYVAAVHPQRLWRAGFIELTRRFEQEWYGVHESSREALDECRDWARSILDAAARDKGAA
jgi:hypothetical protein